MFQNVSKLNGTNLTILHMCYKDNMDNKVPVKPLRTARAKKIAVTIRGTKLFSNGAIYC